MSIGSEQPRKKEEKPVKKGIDFPVILILFAYFVAKLGTESIASLEFAAFSKPNKPRAEISTKPEKNKPNKAQLLHQVCFIRSFVFFCFCFFLVRSFFVAYQF
jgi:hypothetical protein